ncbi:Hypothetical protein ABZS17D1_03391 [Kosakonia cowanii]
MPDGANAYPAYKNSVTPSGNAGWRCAYPAYKIVRELRMALRLSGLQKQRDAIGQCRMALTLTGPTSGIAGWR